MSDGNTVKKMYFWGNHVEKEKQKDQTKLRWLDCIDNA
jgi:hypothetical protein